MNTNKRINEFLDKKNIFAVVGVSANPKKYGYKVFKDLLNVGYKVYPIHPKNKEIDGNKCYSNLEELPGKPDVIVMVVPPDISLKVVKQCQKLGINKVWLQPGSENVKILSFCKEKNILVLSNICIMLKIRN